VSEIRELGRATQGVTLINLGEGEKLSGIEKIVETDEDEDGEIDSDIEINGEIDGDVEIDKEVE
jgi:DNA gyrase subunit A